MNREILFRGKQIDNGEWVEGAYFPDKKGDALICTNIISEAPIDESAMCITWGVDPATIGQFTGLTDKNGKKVFDGDILRFGKRHLLVWWNCEAFQWQAKMVAGYDLIHFGIQDGAYWTNIDLGWIYSEVPTLGKMTTEVIGNIHDNPELLEGK